MSVKETVRYESSTKASPLFCSVMIPEGVDKLIPEEEPCPGPSSGLSVVLSYVCDETMYFVLM